MKHPSKYVILITLIILTILSLVVHRIGLYKTLTIPLHNSAMITGLSDIIQGGASTIDVDKSGTQGVRFKCNLIPQYEWPYCELKISLAHVDEQGNHHADIGYDLSEYSEIFLNMDYIGPAPERVRIYLRNYNEVYTDLVAGDDSMKVNELEYSPNLYPGGGFFNMSDFNVASWWSRLRELPPELQGLELTNVSLIEIASSGIAEYGEMQVHVKDISFRRLYITKENLLLSIVIMWLAAAFLYLIVQLRVHRISLANTRQQQTRLLEITHALKLEKNEINRMIKRDGLTGLRNRIGLSQHLASCENELRECNTPFSIIFIDIDLFKNINDQYGHNVGDDILIEFAQEIYKNIRIDDKLARWGGEEFILLCKKTSLEQALIIAEKICLHLSDNVFSHNLRITASFGVAQMHPQENTKNFINRADQALYQAKKNGRNQAQASTVDRII